MVQEHPVCIRVQNWLKASAKRAAACCCCRDDVNLEPETTERDTDVNLLQEYQVDMAAFLNNELSVMIFGLAAPLLWVSHGILLGLQLSAQLWVSSYREIATRRRVLLGGIMVLIPMKPTIWSFHVSYLLCVVFIMIDLGFPISLLIFYASFWAVLFGLQLTLINKVDIAFSGNNSSAVVVTIAQWYDALTCLCGCREQREVDQKAAEETKRPGLKTRDLAVMIRLNAGLSQSSQDEPAKQGQDEERGIGEIESDVVTADAGDELTDL